MLPVSLELRLNNGQTWWMLGRKVKQAVAMCQRQWRRCQQDDVGSARWWRVLRRPDHIISVLSGEMSGDPQHKGQLLRQTNSRCFRSKAVNGSDTTCLVITRLIEIFKILFSSMFRWLHNDLLHKHFRSRKLATYKLPITHNSKLEKCTIICKWKSTLIPAVHSLCKLIADATNSLSRY